MLYTSLNGQGQNGFVIMVQIACLRLLVLAGNAFLECASILYLGGSNQSIQPYLRELSVHGTAQK